MENITVYIHRTMHFEMPYTRDRSKILQAKIDYLKKYNHSEQYIEGVLHSNGYSFKEIRNIQ